MFPSAPRITVSNVHYTLPVYNLFLSAAQDFACLRHRVSFKKFSARGQNSHLRIEMRAAAAATNPVGPCTLFLWTACVSLLYYMQYARAMYIIIVIWALNIASCVWLPYWCTLAALAQKRYAKRVRPHVHFALFRNLSLFGLASEHHKTQMRSRKLSRILCSRRERKRNFLFHRLIS